MLKVVILNILSLFASFTVFAESEMRNMKLLDLSTDMRPKEVDQILKLNTEIDHLQNRRQKLRDGTKYRQDMNIRFKDDKFLKIGFQPKPNLVTLISLIYQGKSYQDGMINELLKNYPAPDFHEILSGVHIYAWGSKTLDAGIFIPSPGIHTIQTITHNPFGKRLEIELIRAKPTWLKAQAKDE